MLVNFHGTSPTHTQLTHTHTQKSAAEYLKFPAVAAEYLMDTPPPPHSPALLLPLLKMDTTQRRSFICSDGLLLSFVGFVSFSANSCYLPQLLLLLLLMLWLLQCVLFRSITVTSARYLSVKTQTHVSTSRSHLLLLLFPHLSCLSLGRLISKAWNIFPPLLWQAHARAETPLFPSPCSL